MIKGLVCLSMLVLIGFGQLWSQDITIKGKVLDEADDSPLSDVTIQVMETGKGGFSDDEGAFVINTSSKGSLSIRATLVDYLDTTYVLTTKPGQTEYTLDIRMKGVKSIEYDPTVITDSRHAKNLTKVTTSMAVIDPGKVDLQASNDIEDVLNQTSGVDIIDGQPNIRGSSGYAYGVGSRVMVMLDGLPLLSGDASAAQFDLIPTDNIQQVEIMKGASSVLYGSSALGGVINVITADAPDTGRTSIRLRGSMFSAPKNKALDWDGPNKSPMTGAINLFHARKIGRHDVTGLFDFWKETGWKNRAESEQVRVMIMTKFRPKAIEGLTWGINGTIKSDSSSTNLFWDSYLPGDSVYGAFSTTPINSQGAYSGISSRRDQLNMRYTLDPFVKYLTNSGGVINYRAHLQRQVFKNNTNQSNRSTVFYNDLQYTQSLLEGRMTWVSGGTFIYNAAYADSLYAGGHHSINPAVYTQVDGAIKSWLTATVGGRFDYILIDDSIKIASPVFRAGLNLEPTKGTNIRLSWGQAFRSPSVSERYTSTFANGLIIRPNPTIEVEKGYSAELAIRQGFMFGTKKKSLVGFVDLAGFTMRYNNMIEFGVNPPDSFLFPPVIEFSARNVSEARIFGYEASGLIQLTYDKWHFDVTGGITYIDPKNLNPTPDSAQVDFYNTLGPQDNPNGDGSAFLELLGLTTPTGDAGYKRDNPVSLKYRSKWTNRATATLSYGRYSFSSNYRFKSQVLAIDQFLYVAIPGSADFVRAHPKGFTVVDFIFGVDLIEGMKLSLNMDNAFNTEWAVLPGIMGEPRNFSLQLKYVF